MEEILPPGPGCPGPHCCPGTSPRGALNNPPWLCPNGMCEHGLVLHDWDDEGPACCMEGCACRPSADTSDVLAVGCGRAPAKHLLMQTDLRGEHE